jgi:tetratricopeptide (TPR) repeat protein
MLPIMASLMILASVPALAARHKPKPQDTHTPVILVLGAAAAGNSGGSDPQTFSMLIDQLKSSGRLIVMPYAPDLPAVKQAVQRNLITQGLLDKGVDEKSGVAIGKAIGADYLLNVVAGIASDYETLGNETEQVGKKMQINADLFYLKTGKKSVYQVGSRIADIRLVKSDTARDNAACTASSGVATQIISDLFGAAAALSLRPPHEESPSNNAVRDLAAEYKQAMNAAGECAARSDVPSQIVALRSAINLQPANLEPRLKIVALYSDLGMTREAIDECRGALLFNPDNTEIFNRLSDLYASSGKLAKAADDYAEMVRLNPGNADIRLCLGDVYWNLGRIDDAEKAYVEAGKLSTGSSAPHDRLAKLYIAKKKYDQALDQMLQSKLIADASNPDASAQYSAEVEVAQTQIGIITNRLSTSDDEYAHEKLAREGYYQECKDDQAFLDALDKFIAGRPVPQNMKTTHSHLVLALALLSQANSSEQEFLETEKQHYSEEAGSLRAESKAELATFVKALGKS